MKAEQLLRLIKACEKRLADINMAIKTLNDGGRASLSIAGTAYSTSITLDNTDHPRTILLAVYASIDTELQRYQSALAKAEDAINEFFGEVPSAPIKATKRPAKEDNQC